MTHSKRTEGHSKRTEGHSKRTGAAAAPAGVRAHLVVATRGRSHQHRQRLAEQHRLRSDERRKCGVEHRQRRAPRSCAPRAGGAAKSWGEVKNKTRQLERRHKALLLRTHGPVPACRAHGHMAPCLIHCHYWGDLWRVAACAVCECGPSVPLTRCGGCLRGTARSTPRWQQLPAPCRTRTPACNKSFERWAAPMKSRQGRCAHHHHQQPITCWPLEAARK